MSAYGLTFSWEGLFAGNGPDPPMIRARPYNAGCLRHLPMNGGGDDDGGDGDDGLCFS